jgi:diacylglycerol kinase (ATP)
VCGRGRRDAKRGEKLVRPEKGQQGVALSFNHAYRGLIYAVRTQRNMRFHVIASAVVLVLSLLVGVSKLELAMLVLVIMAVFVAELLNTALEFAVDLVTREYHPLAKLAKDVSAGAVLVTSIAALAVGYLVLSDNLGPFSLEMLERVRRWPGHLTLVALVLVAIAVLLGKALTRAPNSFLGGMPSGHAAVSFAGWVAASFVAADGRFAGLVSLITLLMALLVCQSRVESGIHTPYEVAAGALLGSLLAVAVLQLF